MGIAHPEIALGRTTLDAAAPPALVANAGL